MSASLIAAPSFVAAALHDGVLHAFEVSDRLVVLLRQDAPSSIANESRSSAKEDEQPRVLMWRRSDGTFETEWGEEPHLPGDEVIIVASHPFVP